MTSPPVGVVTATDLILALFSAADEALASTDPAAVARKYGQSVQTVEHYTRVEIDRRANGGVRVDRKTQGAK